MPAKNTSVVLGDHTSFYRALRDHLEVIRVLHQRMDPSWYL